MGYNNNNYYKRIIDVQEITLKKQDLGLTNKRIYEEFIYPKYLISKRTFNKYLGIPAKRELRKLENPDNE